jgi:ABC-2 type transport system permease protein
MSLYRAIEFRSGVAIQYLLDLVWYLVQFSVLRVAYEFVPDVGGYTLRDMYVFMGFLFIIDAFAMIFYQEGIELFIRSIRTGQLDYFLLRPASPLFQLALSRVSLTGLMNVFFCIGFWIFLVTQFTLDFAPSRWLWALLLLVNGAALSLIFRLLIGCVSFWTVDGRSLGWLFHELLRFGNKPEVLYGGALRFFLTGIVPVLLFSAWPCYVLIRETTLTERIAPFGVTAVLWLVLRAVWMRGVKRYEGVSF